MLLQALVHYYDIMAAQGKISKPGWCKAKISYALQIDEQGNLKQVIPLKEHKQRGKKEVEVPQIMDVPEGVIRSSGVASQFLWDSSSYMLGIDAKGKPERSLECFQAAQEKHQEILKRINCPYARALKNYFATWQPAKAIENKVLQPFLEDILKGANIVFTLDGKSYAQDDEVIAATYSQWRQANGTGKQGQCLVTGKLAPIAKLHPKIKGVRGAQSSGANLISFNALAVESYGHEEDQGYNAPVSETAAFAYGTALNYLLAEDRHHMLLGDVTLVYWAEDGNELCTDVMKAACFNDSETISDDTLKYIFTQIRNGGTLKIGDEILNADNQFYVLGLSPNASRLSVRFFWHNTFGELLKNVALHQEQLQIVKPAFDNREFLPLWQILQETTNKNSSDKAASPLLEGAVLEAILNGTRYPQALLQNIIMRVRADQDNEQKHIFKIGRTKAAIIKACLLRNYKNAKEEVKVALDEKSNNPAYVLGRVFSVLEDIQEQAAGCVHREINSTIKDRYFDSASATPNIIFPLLYKLSAHHLKVVKRYKPGLAVILEKRMRDILDKIDITTNPIPQHLSLDAQGMFILGYYHQTQQRYTKKEEK